MQIEYIVGALFGLSFILFLGYFLYLPYHHKKWRDFSEQADSFYELDEIDNGEPLEKKIGKLVRKKVDKPPVWRNPSYLSRKSGIDPIFKKRDFFWKYYLTFETFEGYKSFTVTKDEFRKYRTQTYGYIYFQDNRFSHFHVRNREDLNLDELIRKNNKKRN